MKFETSVVIMVVVFLGSVWGNFALETYTKGEIKKACYEAAKTNSNITCAELK